MLNTNVIYMDLPLNIKGYIIKMFDENGGEDFATVVINPRYNLEQQREAYRHEVAHYEENDFELVKVTSIGDIERVRHGIG